MQRKILITGGAGFIGSHLVRRMVRNYPQYSIVNLDKLTYAGNLYNLKDLENEPNYRFIKGDITDLQQMRTIFEKENPTDIIHLAAESHVDRSITDPLEFVHTNVLGTAILLTLAREFWVGPVTENPDENTGYSRFHHVSTDEVFGSLSETGFFTEETSYDPHSPYSASKASSDHFVRAYHDTYGLDVVISNCSNNYGSHHFPEKLIPLAIHNIRNNQSIPVYGTGSNVRDWLWVEDHVRAIDLIFHQGKKGRSYAVGGHNEWRNIDLIRLLCKIMDRKLSRADGTSEKLISFVKDRPGHDLRYAIDATRLQEELGWRPSVTFEEGLEKTVDWYLENEEWLQQVTSGNYQTYYLNQYTNR